MKPSYDAKADIACLRFREERGTMTALKISDESISIRRRTALFMTLSYRTRTCNSRMIAAG